MAVCRRSTPIAPAPWKGTGQLSQMDEIGLLFFVARWADPMTGHFVQADTIVPSAGNAKDFNRYAYGRYNPLVYVDPSGNFCVNVGSQQICSDDHILDYKKPIIKEYTKQEAATGFVKVIRNPLPNHSPQSPPANFGQSRNKYSVENHPDYGKWKWHASIDVGGHADLGKNVKPVYSGKVTYAGWDSGGLGNVVVIEHHYRFHKYYSIYGHLGETKDQGVLVKTGDYVTWQTSIGLVGTTAGQGNDSYPHLHFEIRYANHVDLAKENPLNGKQYWAIEGIDWKNLFLDLGSVFGYHDDNFEVKR